MSRTTHRLEARTWPEVEQYLTERAAPTIIVPIGATEQHGPHLPLAVDAYQARDLADEVVVADTVGSDGSDPMCCHQNGPATVRERARVPT